MDRKSLFKSFLNFLWLRPENALLLTLRADALQSTFKYVTDQKRTIDISCGDGVFSFLAGGGELSLETDMFRSIDVSKTFREGDHDHYDKYDEDYFVEVEKKPNFEYEYGTDWKPNLLSKAEHLNFYSDLIEHDNNNPLPFGNEEMEYVYSNSTYWVEGFKKHLRDLVRITQKGGHIVLQIKNRSIKENTSKKYAPFMGEKFHEIIDAGRWSNRKGLRSKDEVLQVADNIENSRVRSVEPLYGGLPVRMWDIGLRPLFSPLSKMANGVSLEERKEVKKEWCEILYEMFKKYLIKYEPQEESVVEHQIVIEKK
jgi:SAM-dependent methyltransferase